MQKELLLHVVFFPPRLESHGHIVHFASYFEGEEQSVILTEYLEGGELFQRISSKDYQLTEAKCRDFFRWGEQIFFLFFYKSGVGEEDGKKTTIFFASGSG